jgi:putative transposase
MSMKNDFYSRGRSVSDLKAHLVVTTKYRKKVFTDEMLTRLHEITEGLLEQWECRLIEINGEENHVHILFQYHPAMELSKFVNNFKSVSSRKLRQEFPRIIIADGNSSHADLWVLFEKIQRGASCRRS